MAKNVCVDFDGTIIPWGDLNVETEPFPGVCAAMQQLRMAEFRIFIFTSRMSKRWWKLAYKEQGFPNSQSFGASQKLYIMKFLEKWAIPYDEITAEKVPALVYFDDRAIRIREGMPLELAVSTFLAVDHAEEWGGDE